MKFDDLHKCVRNAINMLYERDLSLFKKDLSEWSISHRLAVYLEQELPGWNVDCEYNRQGDSGKKKDSSDHNIRPDIAIHHRGREKKEENLLHIEIKKTIEGQPKDFQKLKDTTSDPTGKREFQYQFGLAILLGVSTEGTILTWFENGVRKRIPRIGKQQA
jgi:hypothetical protein